MNDSPPKEATCAVVWLDDNQDGFNYAVICHQSDRQARGKKADKDSAMTEARFWLAHFGCSRRGCKVTAVE